MACLVELYLILSIEIVFSREVIQWLKLVLFDSF
jgi:hypothetical protein